jgi:hypothetical protein
MRNGSKIRYWRKDKKIWNLGNVTKKVMKHVSLPILLLPVIEKNQPDFKPEWLLGA